MFSYNVYQLSDREAKLDNDNVGDVARRACPLAVATKKAPEELILSPDTSPVFSQHWRGETGQEEQQEGERWKGEGEGEIKGRGVRIPQQVTRWLTTWQFVFLL